MGSDGKIHRNRRLSLFLLEIGSYILLGFLTWMMMDKTNGGLVGDLQIFAVSLGVLIISSRVALEIGINSVKKDIDQKFSALSQDKIEEPPFENARVAFKYVSDNAGRAKEVYNTRFASPLVRERQIVSDALSKQDEAIWSAVFKNHLTYRLLYDENFTDEAEETIRKYNEEFHSRTSGEFIAKIYKDNTAALLQFTILVFEDSVKSYGDAEVLYGWKFEEPGDTSEIVLRSGNPSVINFFIHLFERYSSSSVCEYI